MLIAIIISISVVIIIIIGWWNLTNQPPASRFQSRGCNWPLFVNFSSIDLIIIIILITTIVIISIL